jgi:hypothetical protein
MWVINGNCDLWTVQEGRFSLYHIPYPIKNPLSYTSMSSRWKILKKLITQDFQNKKMKGKKGTGRDLTAPKHFYGYTSLN